MHSDPKPIRSEDAILSELSELCTSDGYIHALAVLCFRGHTVTFLDKITPKDFEQIHTRERLTGTEIATLTGLLVKRPLSLSLPPQHAIQKYIDQTDALLKELHKAILKPVQERVRLMITSPASGGTLGGSAFREAMFYGPDSAYGFQFRDFSKQKFKADQQWLQANRGFTYQVVPDVLRGVARVHEEKLSTLRKEWRALHPDSWTLLPACYLTAGEISEASGVDPLTVENFLAAFAVQIDNRNEQFTSLHDFNVVTARPLLRVEDGRYILLDQYSLMAAAYDSPFYWMMEDPDYCATAESHRGEFTETFCAERLERVFGRGNVHRNVHLLESKGKRVGEIDVLVTFGNRALVLQAKSKKLTLAARKGNDEGLRADFKKSVQGSYDQALQCSKALLNPQFKVVDSQLQPLKLGPLKVIYPLCVVSDHYPALSMQARDFLIVVSDDVIKPPLVMDIFTLDAITEMLESPLHFLSYIDRRVTFSDRVIASHELMVLGFHLKTNLWVADEITAEILSDEMSIDLDVAMTVRRDNLPGERTPSGILTRYSSTTIDHIIRQVEASPHPGALEFGLLLLTLGEDTVLRLSRSLDQMRTQTIENHNHHDITLVVDRFSTGFTIHSNEDPDALAARQLEWHCTRRKYAQKARVWLGICIRPVDADIRFGTIFDYPWKSDPSMDGAIKQLKPAVSFRGASDDIKRKRAGRNDPCHCGSGIKYKKCHGGSRRG